MNNGYKKVTSTENGMKMMREIEASLLGGLDKSQEQMTQDLEESMQQAIALASSQAGQPGASYNIVLKRLYEWRAFFTTKTRIYVDEESLQAYRKKLDSIFAAIDRRIENMKKAQAELIAQSQSIPAKAASGQAGPQEKQPEDMTDFEFQWKLQQMRNESQAKINKMQRDAFWKSRGVK